ncbi:7081_t:CDS:2 [Acaulospora colombiana]|uniref:7081_t:CDS:1 n=1 Tax=Acaulospora colombiana TaxID=27376 RepID=A0ACA9KCB7_9GLOM|nr:7081_t:CDS:2 [Acaulospora colombiana]
MAQRTKVIFSRNAGNDSKGSRFSATKLSVSMRTINNNLQTLSNISKKRTESQGKQEIDKESPQNVGQKNMSTFSEPQRLIETTLIAIYDLELFEAKLNLKSLDLEKAFLNLIKKMLEFGFVTSFASLRSLRSEINHEFRLFAEWDSSTIEKQYEKQYQRHIAQRFKIQQKL